MHTYLDCARVFALVVVAMHIVDVQFATNATNHRVHFLAVIIG